MTAWGALLFAYLLGSIPSAYLVGRAVAGVDIRHLGDGNVGARNVYYQVGALPAAVVLFMDVAKGALAIWLARAWDLDDALVYLMGLAVALGHDLPIFLRFRGGQGTATILGVLWMIIPLQTSAGVGVALAILALSRNWDLSMAVGLGLIPLLAWWAGRPPRQVLYPIALLPIIGAKKLIDRPRARRLRAMAHGSGQHSAAPHP
jgi:glycerol-3-phosphate acyltransferase PlsY